MNIFRSIGCIGDSLSSGEFEYDAQTDIDRVNYMNNKGTLVGWYARIIQRLQSIQPDAKFFLMTMPKEDGSEEAFAEVIKSIAGRLRNCYVIDLYTYAPPYDEAFKKKYFCGHMNAMGYLLTAHYVMTYIDWIIRHNADDFAFVQFIGSGYKPFDGRGS